MSMAGVDAPSLREIVAKEGPPRSFYDRGAALRFTDLARGTSFGDRLRELAGRSVLLATESQLTGALALIELEGVARRIVILPPDADPAHLAAIISIAGIDAVVVDEGTTAHAAFDRLTRVVCRPMIESLAGDLPPRIHTEWVMMTSGTTGVPKMVIHDLATLTTALRVPSPADGADVWGTFYDIRRYGGLQIYLRAVCGGASLVLSSAGEPVPDHLARLGGHGVTHLSGTPSQWRRALMMMPANQAIAPRYVRLSGEIADQAVLDSLRAAFPDATTGHAYASTEAGVVFDVNDGMAGFPTEYIGTVRNGVAMKILDGTLRIRSSGAAKGYVGGGPLLEMPRASSIPATSSTAWRAFLFRRPQGRRHQYRRLESTPGRDRGGDQPASVRAHVAGARPAKSGHRFDRGRRCGAQGRGAGARQISAADRLERRYPEALSRNLAAS